MKKKKTLLILAVILVAMVAAIVILQGVKEHIDKVSTVDEEVLTVDADALTDVTWTVDDTTLHFTKSDDTWTDADDDSFPVDQDKMAELLEYFASVHASFIIEDVEDYDQYGLETPEGDITFTTEDGDQTITFGTFSTMDEKRYIGTDDGNVYLIDDDLMSYLSSDKSTLMKNSEIPSFTQVKSMTISGDNTLDIEYDPDGDYTYSEDVNYYLVDGDDHEALSDTLVESLISDVTGMSQDSCETYALTDDDLSKYGLDDPSLTIDIQGEVTDEDGNTSDAEMTLAIGYVSDDKVFARFGEDTIVYDFDADSYTALKEASYDSLRPVSVADIDMTKVTAITAETDDESYTFDVKHGSSEDTYKLDGEEVSLGDAVSSLSTLQLSEAGTGYDEGRQELKVTIEQDDEDYPELVITLYRLDGDSCVCEFNDEQVGLVSRSAMSQLREYFLSAALNKGKTADETESE